LDKLSETSEGQGLTSISGAFSFVAGLARQGWSFALSQDCHGTLRM
jgi:hypothetical protein